MYVHVVQFYFMQPSFPQDVPQLQSKVYVGQFYCLLFGRKCDMVTHILHVSWKN